MKSETLSVMLKMLKVRNHKLEIHITRTIDFLKGSHLREDFLCTWQVREECYLQRDEKQQSNFNLEERDCARYR